MKAFVLSLVLISGVVAYGQQDFRCITDSLDDIEILKDPTILEKRKGLEEFTKMQIQNPSKSEERMIIPIVFHVLHQYGDERITFEQIENSVNRLNEDFNAENSELNGVVADFRDIIGNANIEFRLAKLDPEGNCTNGVVFYDTELTNNASNSLKYTIKNWSPQSYLNVWTVKSIVSGAAAWSHYPGVSATNDGVVSIYRYITSGNTLTHEIGHYLNLAHPWGSTNDPELESNCNLDDYVDDTPNTIGTTNCNLSQVSCGSLDNVQNFMDYSHCYGMFTQGQVDRMRAALNYSASNRNNLWTEANLIKTGTQDGYVADLCAPIADFSSEEIMLKQGDSYTFEALSTGVQLTQLEWNFEQGEPSVSNLKNPVVTYNVPGIHKVSLTVKNDNGQNTLTREKFVRVIDTLQGIVAPIIYDMEDEDFPIFTDNIQEQWQFINNDDGNWEPFSLETNTMFRILNQKNDTDTKNAIISPNINLSNIEEPLDYIYFDYAYAQRNNSSYDKLKVYVSDNCGKAWTPRFSERGKSLATNGGDYITSTFIPNNDEWETGKINLSYNKEDKNIMLKFEMLSKGGNALYIDNIQIGTPQVSIHDNIINNHRVNIYPNPALGKVNISYSTKKMGATSLKIYNVLGKLAYSLDNIAEGRGIVTVNLTENNFNSGMYIVEFSSGGSKSFKRFIVSD